MFDCLSFLCKVLKVSCFPSLVLFDGIIFPGINFHGTSWISIIFFSFSAILTSLPFFLSPPPPLLLPRKFFSHENFFLKEFNSSPCKPINRILRFYITTHTSDHILYICFLTFQGDSSKHEALGNEWLETGNCPIAKSYRAVSGVLPLVASALQPPQGMKFKCPPAVVAARAALARTALVKTLRPQPLPEKMLVIGVLGMAANVPLGIWREHTRKFSLSWFAAVHAAVPFIAMLRKSVVMPKTAMALTIAASVLGQVIGSRAERLRLKMKAEREVATPLSASAGYDFSLPGNCGSSGITWDPLADKAGKSGSLSTIGYSDRVDMIGGGHCGTPDGIVWDPLGDKGDKPASSSANVCY